MFKAAEAEQHQQRSRLRWLIQFAEGDCSQIIFHGKTKCVKCLRTVMAVSILTFMFVK